MHKLLFAVVGVAFFATNGFGATATADSAANATHTPVTCRIDGDYVHANSEHERRVEILSIRGKRATIFEREPRRDAFGVVHEPVRWVGPAVHQDRYQVRTAPAVHGQRFIDLVSARPGGHGYTGFDFDCVTRQIFHPSTGDWTRIGGRSEPVIDGSRA